MSRWIITAVTLALLVSLSAANPITKRSSSETELIILHNNDMHARFEQTSRTGAKCTPEDAKNNKCYGGFARVAYEVRKHRKAANEGGTPVLYLNAGDTYTGTPWFAVFKDNISAAFLNKLQPDAASLGNHEFDEGIAGLLPFLNNVEFPILACNLDLSKVPEMAATKHLAKSTVLNVNGIQVGVIGYLTPDTKFLVAPNDVGYMPEISSINIEAKKMKAQGIEIIIALGHSGYNADKNIAESCPDVDIVIGGHSHSFLYTGTPVENDPVEGPYPTTVTQKSGKQVPVVQAYAYTKYLGKVHLKFDKDGNLIEFDGTPILLDGTIPREDDVLALLEQYRPNITELEHRVVGHTKVQLEGSAAVCRKEECNLGNLIADAFVYARVVENQGGQYWTDAAVAFINSGGIRNSIDKNADGTITGDNVMSVLPFGNDLYVSRISGKTILRALEHSATVRFRDSSGGYLQMSGAYVQYDYDRPEGHRVVFVELRCAECNVPSYAPLEPTTMYNVIVPEFILNQGDSHVFEEPDNPQTIKLKLNDQEALERYLQDRHIVYPEIEGRIYARGGTAALVASFTVMILAFLSHRLI